MGDITKELRIGNYGIVGNTIVQVRAISEDPLLLSCVCNVIHTEDAIGSVSSIIEPEPLTEAWLLAFKFYKDFYGMYYLSIGRKGFRISITESGFFDFAFMSDIGMDYYVVKTIEYVHELQNLVFSLTDKEL